VRQVLQTKNRRDTKMTDSKGWTPEEQAKIAEFMKKGHSRAVATRLLRAGGKEKVAVVAKVEKKSKAGYGMKAKGSGKPNSERTFHKPTPKQREEIDALIRKAIGKGVAVEGCLGSRFSNSEVGGQPYERYYLSNGHTCFVSGHVSGEYKVTISEKPAVKSSYTVKKLLDRLGRKEKRASKMAK
jgi:hypothetical protein